MEINKYLTRIDFEGSPSPDLATLKQIIYRHFLSVPYENIDILRKIPLSLDTDKLYEKIVINNRGGYCFELNALLNRLLSEIGFAAKTYFARFVYGEKEIPMRRHRIMSVCIDGKNYIADVGVGIEVPIVPVEITENVETEIKGTLFKFVRKDFLGWVLCIKKHNDEWRDMYAFTEEEQLEVDFVQPNFYCQYSPDSIFNKSNMVAIRTETGRKTIDGNTFKIFDGDSVIATEYGDEQIKGIMEREFGIRY